MPLRIAIDARRLGDFGIGTYIRNLVRSLARLDRENHYTLIIRPKQGDELAANAFADKRFQRYKNVSLRSHFDKRCMIATVGQCSCSAPRC